MDTFNGVPWFIWGVIIAATASLVALIVNSYLTSKRDRRQASASIAQHRIEWIERLRTAVSDLLYSAYLVATTDAEEQKILHAELHKKAFYIYMLLNPEQHKDLKQCIVRFFYPEGEEARKYDLAEIAKLRDETISVLKAEWEVAKAETMGRSEALDRVLKNIGASIEILGMRFSWKLL